jgi:hypothetical protein
MKYSHLASNMKEKYPLSDDIAKYFMIISTGPWQVKIHLQAPVLPIAIGTLTDPWVWLVIIIGI